MKLGRNDKCHCNSGKKYKKCCLRTDQALAEERALNVTLEAMKNAGIPKPLIYAFKKTKKIITDENYDRCSKEEIADWNSAIDEYLQEHPEEALGL